MCGRTARERLELYADEDRVVVPGPVRIDPAQAGGAVDLVFLAVKSTQVAATAPWLRALCGADTVVCVLQNGDRPLEWDTRNGVVQRRGRAHGLPTPISDLVVPLLAAAGDGPG